MDLLNSLFSRSLSPAWSFSCTGTLWRLLLSDEGTLVGECRDEQQKKTVFFCLESSTGVLRWRHEWPEEPWWIGVEAVAGNRVLLHGFETPDLPGHKRIIALDLHNGSEVWRNDELTFWFAYKGKIYAYKTRFEKRVGVVLDLETGTTVEEHEDLEALAPLRNLAREEDAHESLEFPELFDAQGAPDRLSELVERETRGQRVVGSVETVVHDPFLVMNYHSTERGSDPERPMLENRLLILDTRSGRRLYSETIATHARTPVPDAFFVRGNDVFFIRNLRELAMVRLPGNGSQEE